MSRLARDSNSAPIQCLRPSTTQTVSISGTAANASAVSQRITRLYSNVDCFYSVEGTATTTATPLPAGMIEFIHTYSGDVISIITSGDSGTFYVTEMI
jgi:hypothetical protein